MTTTTTWRLVPSEPDQDWTNAFAARGPRIGTFGATIRDVLDTAPGFALRNELKTIRAALAFLPTNDAAVSGLDRIIGKLDDASDHTPATEPCAPVGQQNEALRQAVMDAIAAALGSAYDCTRVWSAWGVGTMGPDDFSLLADDADRVAELADAAVAAMRPAPAAGVALDRAEMICHQLAYERAKNKRLLDILVGIHNLTLPAPIEVDGKTYMFTPPGAVEILRGLSDRIRAIPDEIAAIAQQSQRTEA